MALVYNCNDDVTAAAFIARLQTNHSFYKHLMKYDVINMKDILSRAQKYIQLEEMTRGSTSRPPKKESGGEKTKQPFAPPKKAQNQG